MKKVHLAVYVTEGEAKLLREVAEGSPQGSFSEWARHALVRLAMRKRPPKRS